jgi:malate dehydrogenase (oxaloacetate-decarboxylating)(NADP+)
MLTGLVGKFDQHLEHVRNIIGLAPEAKTLAAMNAVLLDDRTLFIADTFVNEEPDAESLAEIARMAAEEVRRFGMPPKVAFLSHSMFGSSTRPAARRMRAAAERFKQIAPGVECDGEMHGDTALDAARRRDVMPRSSLNGEANLLVMPNIDAANIAYNLLKTTAGGGIAIGPVLLGAAKPVHILTPSATVRRIVNMTALTVTDANAAR